MAPCLLFEADGDYARLEVTLKITIFLDLTSFSRVDVYGHFRLT